MMANSREKPLLIYDGQCGLCRRWVGRWEALTGDRVEYAPYQEVAEGFPQIPLADFRRAVQLVDVDGRITSGAAAALRAIAFAPRRGLGWWAYRKLPGFATVSEGVYRFVAANRQPLSGVVGLFWGRNAERPTYTLTRRLFLRMLGVVYLIAFLSLFVQIRGLIGENGILPIGQHLAHVEKHFERQGTPERAFWSLPTLCWWIQGDALLQWGLCGGGALLSVLLVLGVAPVPVLVLLWAFYLSLTVAGQTFMTFQWDILLLEAGLLAIFFAPFSLRLGSPRALPPSRIVLFLLRWLLFRLMILSGYTKLASGDSTWHDLSALIYHYESQPLPTWTAWYMHQLPLWAHQASAAIMFFIELVVPFLMFGPRRLRYFAFAATVALMAVIGATGNYNFFNLLTAVLCISLLDDQFLRQFVPRGARQRLAGLRAPRTILVWLRRAWLIPVGAAVVGLSVIKLDQAIFGKKIGEQWYRENARYFEPFRPVNNYGLFRVMTKSRPEIVIEGSNDRRTWEAYEFRWKPGDVQRTPAFVEPHQPRVDWQMWFAALNPRRATSWVGPMMMRILEGSEEVLAFFSYSPFPDEPPRFLRAVLYDYRFTDVQTREETGAWWRRELKGVLFGPIVRPEKPADDRPNATAES